MLGLSESPRALYNLMGRSCIHISQDSSNLITDRVSTLFDKNIHTITFKMMLLYSYFENEDYIP